MALSYTDIQEGVWFRQGGTIYETLETTFSKKSRQKGSNTARLRDVRSGAVVTKTLRASDKFEEVSVEKEEYVYIYTQGEKVVVHEKDTPKHRITVDRSLLRSAVTLPEKTPLKALTENGEILSLIPPIKVVVTVKEAPPSIRGNTAQGGTKRVVADTGDTFKTPLFIEEGETIQIHTETGEYVERAKPSNA